MVQETVKCILCSSVVTWIRYTCGGGNSQVFIVLFCCNLAEKYSLNTSVVFREDPQVLFVNLLSIRKDAKQRGSDSL